MTQSQDPRPVVTHLPNAIDTTTWAYKDGLRVGLLGDPRTANPCDPVSEAARHFQWEAGYTVAALSRQEASGEVREALKDVAQKIANMHVLSIGGSVTSLDHRIRLVGALRRSIVAEVEAALSAQPLADAGNVERMEQLPEDVLNFVSEAGLLATNHGGWFDNTGFKAISPLCDWASRILERYRANSTAPDELPAEGDVREIIAELRRRGDTNAHQAEFYDISLDPFFDRAANRLEAALARPDRMAEMEGALSGVDWDYVEGAVVDFETRAGTFSQASIAPLRNAVDTIRAALSSGSEGGRNG